ncbi:MAG TPA: S41 family peptidase [bacterium]|nr:S41 family peptidase [bacterium]
MKRFRVLSAVLIGAVAVMLAMPGAPRAEAADAQFVLAALRTLEAHYVDPLSAPTMLNAALDSARDQSHAASFGGPIPADADAAEAARLFTQRFDEILSQAHGEHASTEVAYAAVAGMLDSLHDSHTAFIPPSVYQEEQRREDGDAAFTGIGIELLARNGSFYVSEVYPDSPASVAGVRTFDRVVAVDGQATSGLADDAVSAMVRGAAGSSVVLTVDRPGQTGSIDLRVTRAPIHVPRVTSRMLDDGIGYVKIYEFVQGTGAAFREAIFGLRRSGMRAMVLDLRGNPGGLVDELRDVSAALLPQRSPFIRLRTRSGRDMLLETSDPPIVPATTPLVVLVDEGTGSAAELLTAALQEQSRAVVTGARTAGAVEIGITVDLPEGAGMAITVARVWSGHGARLEGHGVTPDDPEALSTDAMNLGHDSQLDKALETLRTRLGSGAGFRPVPALSAHAA